MYLEKWNPSAKKYINVCGICGRKGYSPVVKQDEFCSDLGKAVIYRELSNTLCVMTLDRLGRCEDCARVQDSVKN